MRLGPWEKESLERPINAAGQLLVEGRTPEIFFLAMAKKHGWTDAINVRTFGSINKESLQTYLEIFTQKRAFKEKVQRVGIVRDAESSTADDAFKSVQAALRDAKLFAPGAMNVLEGNPLAVGVFVLPNCKDVGMLESLCLTAITEVEAKDLSPVLPCVDAFFACVEGKGKKAANPTKARFAGYALACDVIDPQLGGAAQRGAIPWQAGAFDLLKAFVRDVVGRR